MTVECHAMFTLFSLSLRCWVVLAYICNLITFTGLLTVDDVLDYFGFGRFQWAITFISGTAWVWNLSFIRRRAELSRVLFPGRLWQSVLPPRGQVGDAMEIVILSILSSQLRCEWRLDSYQVALMSSVRKPDSTGMFGESWRTSRFFPPLADCVSRHLDRLPYLGDLLRQVRQKNRECPTCPVSCWFPACFNVWISVENRVWSFPRPALCISACCAPSLPSTAGWYSCASSSASALRDLLTRMFPSSLTFNQPYRTNN